MKLTNAANFDVIIIGGGVIGASIAWRLARNSFRVLLFDASTIGSEASSAAAGMLSPAGEFEDPALRHFAIASLTMYPDFIREIEADSGLAVEFRRTGAVELVLAPRPGSRLLSPAELRALAPLVRHDAPGAIYFPDDAIIDPAALMTALRSACLARGVCVREQCSVAEIRADSEGATIAGARARSAVLAAGAWSSSIAITIDSEPHSLPRSFPVKGHLLGYRLPPGSLATIVRQAHTYVLQRADGFTIAGSSTEDAGYNRIIDQEIVSNIAARAAELVPTLRGLQPESVWTGFRPATDAAAPNVGRVPSSRLWLAYGHYRNGILLAPATCDRICQEIAATLAATASNR
ncbi:MAG: FAD-dependent oxidoreductase [Bryobacteraceae bacterium]